MKYILILIVISLSCVSENNPDSINNETEEVVEVEETESVKEIIVENKKMQLFGDKTISSNAFINSMKTACEIENYQHKNECIFDEIDYEPTTTLGEKSFNVNDSLKIIIKTYKDLNEYSKFNDDMKESDNSDSTITQILKSYSNNLLVDSLFIYKYSYTFYFVKTRYYHLSTDYKTIWIAEIDSDEENTTCSLWKKIKLNESGNFVELDSYVRKNQ